MRHYFVAFMSPAESRGLDGLIASYAELTADQGHITLTRSADISALNSALGSHGGGHISAPADYLARYGGYHPEQFFQNLTFSPDMPSVSTVVAQLYAQAGGGHLDGVSPSIPKRWPLYCRSADPFTYPGSASSMRPTPPICFSKVSTPSTPTRHSKACGGTSSKRPYAGPFNDCPPDRCPVQEPCLRPSTRLSARVASCCGASTPQTSRYCAGSAWTAPSRLAAVAICCQS